MGKKSNTANSMKTQVLAPQQLKDFVFFPDHEGVKSPQEIDRNTPITLFHGTTLKRARTILKKGIVPRSEKVSGNYSGCEISKNGLVYLTTWAAFSFAELAAECSGEHEIAIIKATVPFRHLYPDEDYIARSLWGQDQRRFKISRAKLDPRKYYHLAIESLINYGCVATPRVDPSSIEAIRTFDLRDDSQDEFHWWLGAGARIAQQKYLVEGKKFFSRLMLLFKSDGTQAASREFNEKVERLGHWCP